MSFLRASRAKLVWALELALGLELYACAVLGEGPGDLESWGDTDEVIEAYDDLGFDIVERVQGWELRIEG